MKIFTTFLAIASLIIIGSCKKKDCSDTPESIELTANSPIYEGWPLHLSTTNSEHSYVWSGPNGWSKEYNYSSNMNGNETIDSMTTAKAGRYVVDLVSNGCIVKRGIVDVTVVPVPAPSCNIANNSTTSTMGGVGGTSYTYVSNGSSGSSYYHVQASNSSQTLTFNFKGGHTPLPGVYKSDETYYPSEQNKVGVYIGTGFQDFGMKPNFDIYVNKVNGHTVISFCSAGFYNPVGSSAITVSGKITLP